MNNQAHNHNSLDPENEPPQEEPTETMKGSILKAIWGLSIFAIITAGLIALTQVGTKERIEQQIKLARSKALLEIVPLNSFNNDLLESAFWLKATKELGLSEPAEAFVATQDGVPTHVILPVVATEGYSGEIRLIVSISDSGSIEGVRAIEHKETPGLGDNIDLKKSKWILEFNGKSFENTPEAQWKVKKDNGHFDQLTGATITPRAIVKAVYQALLYFRDHKDQLYQQAGLKLPATLKSTPNTQPSPSKPREQN